MKQNIQNKTVISILSVLSLLLTSLAFAQAQTTPKETESAWKAKLQKMGAATKSACQSDIKKFCAKVPEGEGRIAECLADHSEKLSSACKSSMEDLAAAVQSRVEEIKREFAAACGKDAQKYCGRVPAGEGRVISCLMGREDDLEKSCKNMMTKVHKRMDESMY